MQQSADTPVLCAGDKTIFKWLGLERDRSALKHQYLILGIPGMFRDIRLSIGKSEQHLLDYKLSLGMLAHLMAEKDTDLKRIVDWMQYSRFPDAKYNQNRLAQELHKWFGEQYPDVLPICSDCAQASDRQEVNSPLSQLKLKQYR